MAERLTPSADAGGKSAPRKRNSGGGPGSVVPFGPGGGGGNTSVNSEARAETIRNACRSILDLEGERAKINADISAIKNEKIKGELGMKLSDFATVLRLYKLEDDDRDNALDTIREGFRALGIGGQGDLFVGDVRAATADDDAG